MKTISLLLAFILILSLFPSGVLGSELCIENGSFEDAVALWSNAEYTSQSPFLGEKCLSVLPSQTNNGEFPSFSAQYQKTVLLTRNNIYEISFYIRTDSHISTFTPSCKPMVSTETKHIRLDVINPSFSWQKVTAMFLIDKTDYYTFSVETILNTESTTFLIDEMTLSVADFSPSGISVIGPRTVSVPDVGLATYQFIPCVINKENASLAIQNGMILPKKLLPEGVSFDVDAGLLSVSSTARTGASVVLECHIPGAITISPVSITILLTGSVIENGTFNDMPIGNGWNNDEISLHKDSSGFFAKVPTNYISENTYIGALSPKRSVVLYAEHLYVFRAKVRTDSSYTARNMSVQAVGPDTENSIRFQIANINGKNWNEVAFAFRVPNDGIYNIAIDLHSPYSSYVFIDDISIQPESQEPLFIYFDSPMNIARPKDKILSLPLEPLVVNQYFLPQNAAVSFSVEPENPFVKITSSVLTVSPSAECKEYTLVAFSNDNINVKTKRTLTISEFSVLDGSFENTEPGQAWMTAEPSKLDYVPTYKDIYPSDGHNLARLTMNGSVSMIMSDSVDLYNAGKSYLFESDMSMLAPDIDTVVTVLVDNAYSDSFDDNLVVGQFSLSKTEKHICHLFTPSESVTGRIMIAFNTPAEHDQQVIFLDDVSTSVATVYASSVVISGSPFLDKNIVGNYRFSSNFNALDASTFRWLISDTPNGIFVPIPAERDRVLSITKEMLNKYVKFEVTPVSPNGPVIGESVSSAMILIGESISQNLSPTPSQGLPPILPQPEPPTGEVSSIKSELHAMNLSQFLTAEENISFYDLNNHWASKDIAVLTAANIVQGKGNGLFEPESPITRAEFSTILARAFQLAPIFYENTFSDVRGSDWYAGAIAVITKYGITHGTSSYTFSPNLPITREEMVVMIMRAYQKTGAPLPQASVQYADSALFNSWAASDISMAGTLGLMNGKPGGNFDPKSNATRAEASVVIFRLLTKFLNA